MWAAGCTAFELATGRFLFQPKVAAALLFKDCMDYVFGVCSCWIWFNCRGICTQACQKWSKDDDHLRLITQTVGPLPKEVIEKGTNARKFYRGEKLKKVDEGDFQTTTIVKQLVLQKMWFQFNDVQSFSRWFQLLLNPDPRARATAYQSAKHSFLEQGLEENKEEDVEKVVEVVETVSRATEAAEVDSSDGPKRTPLIQKKLMNLEDKLENVVNMVVEMKARAKKEDELKREELTKLKENQLKLEERIVEQGVEIGRLKGKGGSAEESLPSKLGRNGKEEYPGIERDEEAWHWQQVQARTGGGGRRSRPDFRHQHSTTKAKKVNWEVRLPKARKMQLKSSKSVPKIKDRAGGDKVHLKRLGLILGDDLAKGLKPKVAKGASGARGTRWGEWG